MRGTLYLFYFSLFSFFKYFLSLFRFSRYSIVFTSRVRKYIHERQTFTRVSCRSHIRWWWCTHGDWRETERLHWRRSAARYVIPRDGLLSSHFGGVVYYLLIISLLYPPCRLLFLSKCLLNTFFLVALVFPIHLWLTLRIFRTAY